MQNAKKDYLTKLSVREIRLEAKKLSIHLYSRKNKQDLVKLILKDREKVFIENNTIDEVIAFENVKAEEERKAFENVKAEEERKAFENVIGKEELNINSDKNLNLKRLLSESFPNKKISVTDNNDGSQTILIH
jgi:hypothetical protein